MLPHSQLQRGRRHLEGVRVRVRVMVRVRVRVRVRAIVSCSEAKDTWKG